MHMILFICLLNCLWGTAFSQAGDSCSLRISLITCNPGSELYSTFGHTALRVVDEAAGTDIAYNYGTFAFDDPNFYAKFIRGKLNYYVDQQAFPDFLYEYQYYSREVREQILNITCEEKKQIQAFLFMNIRPENKFYRYDFLYDNCTTRVRDILLKKNGQGFHTANIIDQPGRTFRNHIHYYLNRNQMPWSKLGIDILLGARLDRAMTNEEAMFLPDYLEKAADSTQRSNQKLVAEKRVVFKPAQPAIGNEPGLFTPSRVAWVLLGIGLLLSALASRAAQIALRFFDFLLFFLPGLLGIQLVFMWTATDHLVCGNNYNLLWALPFNTAAAFYVRNPSAGWRRYFGFVAMVSYLLLVSWRWLPQELNPDLIPLVLLIGLRAALISGLESKLPWKNKSLSNKRN
jgi:hypothetical protein